MDPPRVAPAVVAFGGGHGLAASLSALRRLTPALTAVVTVGDDGGSSGRLRAELGALPMGDLRMALAALAGPDGDPAAWAELFQHRFGGPGPLAGHAVGNLVLTGLAERTSSPVAALDLAAGLLGVRGRVLPLATEGIDIVADVAGLDPEDPDATSEVRGQAAVATTAGRVLGVRLSPAEPVACAEAVAAACVADWLVLGPGSLYTSMLPHLLVPGMRQAITSSRARVLMVLNLAAQPGETAGYTPQAHLDALRRHVPGLRVDVVLADPTAVPEPEPLARAAAELGARLHLAPVRVPGVPVHDPVRLAAAFQAVFAGRADRPPAPSGAASLGASQPAAAPLEPAPLDAASRTAATGLPPPAQAAASTGTAAPVPPAARTAGTTPAGAATSRRPSVDGARRPVTTYPSSGGADRRTSSGEAKE
ncbi:uridine diphosphate-N-acetylglucosamine-binding protein YvcK [Frankia sp. AgB32]|uniref:uridine diphosphate-N-acetylglucosamine-binding protein YvcK n=1 Tax=Frankia sp. AgB32 TaxID=631119 RepID=UPI0027E2DFEB|nr:uridine diphosphate-N-acetylglucosamine-binding protein YvcK [Frankia sp. AgB32]